jgi:hypothetical protein
MACNLVNHYQHFKDMCCLYLICLQLNRYCIPYARLKSCKFLEAFVTCQDGNWHDIFRP